MWAGLGRSFRIVGAAVLVAAGLAVTAIGSAQDTAVKKLNKFTGNPDAIKEGRTLYLKYGCSGCHGVGGGGGMGPPLTDDVWKFGGGDEAVYKIIKGQTPSTMPNVFGEQMTDDEVWKIIAYIRSVYAGDKGKVVW